MGLSGLQALGAQRCLLGESPLWWQERLWSIDIAGRELLDWGAGDGVGEPRRWSLPADPGCIAARRGGGLLLAARDGLWAFDAELGLGARLLAPPYEPAGQRFNDGKVDAQGRLWVVGMSDAQRPEATLFRIDAATGASPLQAGFRIGNGLGFSPDGLWLYSADSPRRRVWRQRLELDGQLGPRETWLDLDRLGLVGHPDGAAIDADGCYWLALWDGWALLRLSPQGELLERLALPVQKPTMPCFGGADGRTLFISSAHIGLSAAERAAQPWAGAMLSARVAVPGLPVFAYAG